MKTVKEWLQSKAPQFSIVERETSGKISIVNDFKTGRERKLWTGCAIKRDFYFGITEFSEDLIHITFVLVLPKISVETGEVDSLDTSNEFTCELFEFSSKMTELTLQQNPNYFKQKEVKHEEE